MKGWSGKTEAAAATTRPQPEADLYQESIEQLDRMKPGDRFDMEFRKGGGEEESSIVVRRISSGAGVSTGKKIGIHEVTEEGLCDAIKREMQKWP